MSTSADCSCQCATATNTQIPGSAGVNAFTLTTANFIIPAVNANVNILVGDNQWMATYQKLFISDTGETGTFEVQSFTGTTGVTLKFLGYSDDSSPGLTITSGAVVTPSGIQQPFNTTTLKALNATLLAGITAFTDNTGGAASSTLAAGVGVTDWFFYVSLPDITNADLIGAYTPGYAFKVLKTDILIEKAVTTGAKTATLTPKINGSAITGGVLVPAGTYAAGSVIAGTTVSAANTGTAAQTFSITASAVTTFVEGNGIIRVRVQNTDSANAIASISAKLNAILAALQT